jgi:DNA topoisomerase VI subunit B
VITKFFAQHTTMAKAPAAAAAKKKAAAPKKRATTAVKRAAPKKKATNTAAATRPKATKTTTTTASRKKATTTVNNNTTTTSAAAVKRKALASKKKKAENDATDATAKSKSSKAKEAKAAKASAGRELTQRKSPAEFFADNQAIAGFDNAGKALYTTLRELIENALDACESQHILPDISVKVEEMSQPQFNTWRSMVQEFNTKGSSGTHTNNKAKTVTKKKRKKSEDDKGWGSDNNDSSAEESENEASSLESQSEAESDNDGDCDSDGDSDGDGGKKKKRQAGVKKSSGSGSFDLEGVFHGTDWLKHCPIKNDHKKAATAGTAVETDLTQDDDAAADNNNTTKAGATANNKTTTTKRKRSSVGGNGDGSKSTDGRFFRVTVRDNGCGMAHDDIPQMLGRVLSSSKYGVRQTRGKFGLGAKMALIWSKKSTGVPIFVRSKQTKHGLNEEKGSKTKTTKKASSSSTSTTGGLTTCVLDIDIYKNEPRILLHEHTFDETKLKEFGAQMGSGSSDDNDAAAAMEDDDDVDVDNLSGTEMCVVIGGNWSTYKHKVVQYLHQLAVITPYAKLKLEYVDLSHNKSSSASRGRDMTVRYDRRSDQMPEPAKEVKHHPSSVNNLILSRLLDQTKAKTLSSFLSKELSGISASSAKKFCDAHLATNENKSLQLSADTHPHKLHDGQVTRLVQILREQSATTTLFRTPDASCLSPLGEYNLNLGIRKVIEPEYVATARDKPSAHEGHPFLVEAAVSLGGKDSKEGITVTRFANRIPLLFEGGADVVTRVANSKIGWRLYKMDQKRDKIGVFVSIVSTKIPFKGTGKEVRNVMSSVS